MGGTVIARPFGRAYLGSVLVMDNDMYRIGEAAELLQLKSYVLRFWESEFPQLAPLRTDKGQRLYTEEHIALLRRIKHLLHEQGMTIEGARRVVEHRDHTVESNAPNTTVPMGTHGQELDTLPSSILRELRDELFSLRQLLHRANA